MKNDKNNIKYFMIISLLILSILPLINVSKYIENYDYKELYSTDVIEKYINYSSFRFMNISLNMGKVIIGKNGFLFLGNDYSKILDKTSGRYKRNENDLLAWTSKLKNIQNWYEDRGIKFVIVVAPNKATVYDDKLPDWVEHNSSTMTDDIILHSKQKKINILDLREKLKQKKKSGTYLYHRIDSHWNTIGAGIAYNETIDYINKLYTSALKKPVYNFTKERYPVGGDLFNLLKIQDFSFLEDIYKYSFKVDEKMCFGDIDKKTKKLKPCVDISNPIVLINNYPKYIINGNSLNQKTALLICDSYGNANSKLYNLTFEKLFKAHYWHLNGIDLASFVLRNKPDIVIYQIIERDLFNKSIVKELSDNKIDVYAGEINNKSRIFDIHNSKNIYIKNHMFNIKGEDFHVTGNDPKIILNKLKTKSNYVVLHYSLYSLEETSLQLFYKRNKNDYYNENESYKTKIKKGKNIISLSIPAEYINNDLRVDLVSKMGKYKIHDFSIYEVE